MQCRFSKLLAQTIILCAFMRIVKSLIGHNVDPARENEFPFVTCILQYNPPHNISRNLVCSGSLISKTHVLTAEHCFQNLETNVLVVLIGPGEIARSVSYFAIWWISYHQWAAALHRRTRVVNDIAIIKMYGNISEFNVAPLLKVSSNLLDGLTVDVVGCGVVNTGNVGTFIHKVAIPVIPLSSCERLISALSGSRVNVAPNYLCTQKQPYTYLEFGDSGGPAAFYGSIAGVSVGVSPSTDNDSPYKVNMHMTIEHCLDFLEYMLEND